MALQLNGNPPDIAPVRPSAKKKKWNWEHSWAKEIIREALIAGDLTSENTYDEIFLWHPEIAQTDRSRLPSCMRSLRKQIAKDNGKAQQDDADLSHDRALFAIPETNYRGEPRWQGSDTETLMKEDVGSGVHLTMTPAEFYDSRPEYQVYSEWVIRQHIYQEVKFQKYSLYRSEKKKYAFVRFDK